MESLSSQEHLSSSAIILPNSTSSQCHDQNSTPTLTQPSTLPHQQLQSCNHAQSLSWPASLASSSSSSPSSSSPFSSPSHSSLSSPSSSPPLCHHHHPLAPAIPRLSTSSSATLSLVAPSSNMIAPAPKSTRPLFFLPGPALHHPHFPSNAQPINVLNPPSNFATVAPGLFRSSFPKPENFEFLAKLKLRTVLTLVQEPYPLELVKHYEQVGIKLIQYPIPGNKEPFVHIPEDKIRLALRQVLDVRNQPMLIHCNKGKHRTGCLVGCLRKLQHWSSTAIFDEYRRYAFPKSRNMDQQFIELFDHSAVWEEVDPEFAPHWLDLTM